MADLLREAPVGQLIRFMTHNKYFQYPEEKSGFQLPETYRAALDGTYSPSRSPSPSPLELEKEKPAPIPAPGADNAHDPETASIGLTRTKSRAASMPYTNERLEIEQELELERTKTIPIAPQKTADGNILVDWYTTDDPANPQNWSNAKRAFVSLQICLYTFAVYTGSAIYTSGEEGAMQAFGIGPTAASLPLSLYVLAYGIGPLIFAPMSEIPVIGRNPVYMVTFAIFVILSIPTAVVGNFAGLLVLRFLQGFFGSPCLANGGATMQDMYSLLKLPYALTVWVSAAYCGPALGPLLSGFAVTAKGWRWSLW